MMVSLPDNWEFSIRSLAKMHVDSKTSVSSGLNKLLEIGYLTRSLQQSRKDDGSFGCYDYTVYQDPYDNPDFIPYEKNKGNDEIDGGGKEEIAKLPKKFEETTVSQNRDTGKIEENSVSQNRDTVKNGENTVSRNQDTVGNSGVTVSFYPRTDKPLTENQSQISTISKRTIYKKIEDEEIQGAAEKVDINKIKKALCNVFLCKRLSVFRNTEYKKAYDECLATLLSVLESIRDGQLCNRINNSSSKRIEELYCEVYNYVFNPSNTTVIRDKVAYVTVMIEKFFPECFDRNVYEEIIGL